MLRELGIGLETACELLRGGELTVVAGRFRVLRETFAVFDCLEEIFGLGERLAGCLELGLSGSERFGVLLRRRFARPALCGKLRDGLGQ